jgi:putative tRNA adenosine deaminase-associated protein
MPAWPLRDTPELAGAGVGAAGRRLHILASGRVRASHSHRVPAVPTKPTGGTVSYFAAALARGPKGWTATELDLAGAADVEEVADLLRDVDPEADVSLLFVESDDAYLVILRLDEGEDLRVFGSDSAFAEESRLGALLLGEIEEPALEIDEVVAGAEPEAAGPADDAEEPEPAPVDPDVDPVGDPDLLADLGVPAHRLLELCAHDGMLPADVTAEVCQAIGCADEVEELREG